MSKYLNNIKISIVIFTATIAIISSLLLSASVFAAAGINPQFNYQGRLTNSSGANVSDGAYNFVFKLYTASSGGSAVWTETWNTTTRFSSTVTGTPPSSGGVSVTYTDDATESYLAVGDALYDTTANDEVIIEAFNTTSNTITISPTSKAWSASDALTTRIYVRSGLFSSRLGSISSLSSINLNQTPLYLGVSVGADSEMTPRKRITSVLQSFQANKLDGYLTSTSTSAGTEYGSTLTVSDTGIVTTGTDTTYGLNISTTRTGATGGTIDTYGLYSAVTGDTGGTSTAIGGYFSATGADTNYSLIATGKVGVGMETGAFSPVPGFLTIFTNSSNNLTDYGLVQAEQQGGGDAAISWLLTGGRRWYAGIDNSDSDKWKLATTTGTPTIDTFDGDSKLTVDTSGNVGIGTTTVTAGKLVVAQTDAANLQALTIDTEESTGTQNVFSVISDSGSDENTVLNLTAAGNLLIDGSLTTGGASTIYADGSITKSSGSAMNVNLGGAAGDDFIVDTSTLVVESDNDRVGIGTTAPNTALDLNGAFSVRGMSAPSVSPSGQGRIYYDSTANKFKISENGGSYGDLVGDAGAVTWKKVYENDITTPTADVTVSGLDGNTDIEYMVVAYIVGATDGAFSIRLNGDSGNNYGYQYIYGSSSTASAQNTTSATGLFAGNILTNNITVVKGFLYVKSGYVRTFNADITDRASGTTVTVNFLVNGVWNNTADNITSLVFHPANASGIGSGSHLEVWARRSGGGSVWALNGNSAYYTSGNVGVGLNNPSHKLQITDTDTTASRAGLYVAQSGAISGTGYGGYFTKTGASTTNIAGYFSATGATNNYGLIVENGNVGIGTTGPTLGRLQINQAADNNTSGIAMFNAAASQTSRLWMNGGTMNFGLDGTTVMSYNAGNVGIGTTTPGYNLDVAGNVLLGNILYVDNSISQGGIDSNTKLMLSANGSDGSTSFIDSSSGGKTVTANGNAQIDTAQKKFGTASGLFDGTGDYITTPDSDDWYFTGDFTVDFQVRFNSLLSLGAVSYLYAQKEDEDTKILFGRYNNAGNTNWFLFIRNGIGDGGSLSYEVTSTLTANTWYHIALVRSGNNWYIFQDGVQVGSTLVNAKVLNNYSSVLYMGVTNGLVGNFDGWLDEYRVSKGVARWTSNFTAPLAPYDSGNIGKVGIGLTNPSHKLQITDTDTTASRAGLYVAQSGAISGTGYGGYFTKTGASTTNIAGYFSATGATNNYGLIVENGSVGIGTTSPTANLSFGFASDQTILVERRDTAAGGRNLIIQAGGSGSGGTDLAGGELRLSSGISTGSQGSFVSIYTATAGTTGTTDRTPTEKMKIIAEGNVRIGNIANNSYLLNVDGDVMIGQGTTGCVADRDGTVIAGTCSSDIALKKDIVPIGSTLDKLVQISPVYFNWRADEYPEFGYGTEQQMGLIAQDVEKVLPELVAMGNGAFKDFKQIRYNYLPFVLIQAIKDLDAKLNSLAVASGVPTSAQSSEVNCQLSNVNCSASPAWLINSSGRLTSTVDLDLGGKSIHNVGALFGASGKWKLDESGYLEIEKVVAKEIETEKLKIGALNLPAGITLYDLLTKEPYCLYIENGEIKKQMGECAVPAEQNYQSPISPPEADPPSADNFQEITSPSARNDGGEEANNGEISDTPSDGQSADEPVQNGEVVASNESDEVILDIPSDEQPSDAGLETTPPSEPQP